ncbi:putative bifunctional diguanylate cyclase/phosphodiesterase [Leucothrix mucor]|uniref:putative bifunctional diguanylate cyclase/phosphodiesterase n=1 Tax=Leucothrix mucor TaxID=45248 RepID=UPI0003B62068|nr:bifunctional diguanylate cyclase/phosphodiesterase [Leucothrix mucor]
MKLVNPKSSRKAAYFAESKPTIRKRLMPVLLILLAAFTVAFLTEGIVALDATAQLPTNFAFFMKWIDEVILLSTIAGLCVGIYQLKKDRVRSSTNWLLFTCTVSIIAQAFTNGGMGETPLIIYPLLIMTAGFFANIHTMEVVARSCMVSIIALYLLGVFGIKPLDLSEKDPIETFMRLDQMIYCLLIMEVCFRTIKMFVDDYGAILDRVRKDRKKLDFIANHDKLTGLPNRHSCEAHFDELFRLSPATPGMSHLLLFVDIDNFKNINTRFGHNGGDEALSTVARRLDQAFEKDNAVVSRIGGDEFIIMLFMQADQLETRLHGMMKQLAEPLTIFDQTEYITCSMGVIEIKNDTSSFKEEYRKADMAMNRAKKTGKNRFCYFNQSLNDTAVKNIELGAGLHEALKNDEFVLFYQPQVDLATGKVVGAEALIRWFRQDGQMISPADFIPIAEKNGSIIGMTLWVIRQSCIDCARWYADGFKDLFVSVNVPSMMLAEGNLPQIIREECAAVGLDPKYLELELTESVILENGDDIQRQLQDIRDMGVSLAIDDFGTGYSNLSYLSRLNVQKLKVDQYFVMNLLKSNSDRTIVHAITHIASSFGMKTVAEGVEDTALIKPLLDLHCTIGQGYLWSKPVPLDSFMTLLNDYSPTKQLAEATA